MKVPSTLEQKLPKNRDSPSEPQLWYHLEDLVSGALGAGSEWCSIASHSLPSCLAALVILSNKIIYMWLCNYSPSIFYSQVL